MISANVSHCRVVSKIGSGGISDIYQTEDIKLKRTVALIFLSASFSPDQNTKKRLVHKAQSDSAVDHPNNTNQFGTAERLVNSKGLLLNDRIHVNKFVGFYAFELGRLWQ